MSDLNELQAAYNAASKTWLPFAATISFDTAGSTMMGVSPAQFVEFMKNIPASAYGANCGVGPDQLLQQPDFHADVISGDDGFLQRYW